MSEQRRKVRMADFVYGEPAVTTSDLRQLNREIMLMSTA
jgi:hypothetical protein